MIQLHTRVPPSQLGDLVTSVVSPAIKANWASTLGLRNLGTVFVEDLEFTTSAQGGGKAYWKFPLVEGAAGKDSRVCHPWASLVACIMMRL